MCIIYFNAHPCTYIFYQLLTMYTMLHLTCIMCCIIMCPVFLCTMYTADAQPSEDFVKRLGSFIQPRLHRLGGDIKEFVQKTRSMRLVIIKDLQKL